jgi:serine/threonine protein kinase
MSEPSRLEKPSELKAEAMASGIVSIPLPRVMGRFILLKMLARGGMGDVYLAATTGIEGAERPIVVKTVRRDHIHDGSFLARFLDEARVQSQLNHPGVAQILEASTDENGEPYTVVEYVEGRSLADVRHRASQVGVRIGWPEAVALAIEMGQALAHVHERAGADGAALGIVHRDLSPQNVMIGYAGELKLIDFGTARGHNRRCHTVAGVVFAKPGYVAPEVARQQVGDGRIDVYAMGVMLWELCAGKRLLSGDAQKHLEEVAAGAFVIPPLAESRGVPPQLDTIIQKLCANDPDDRYTSAADAAGDLGKVLALAPAGKGGERSVRARISSLMKLLWPSEPARLRSEFAKLFKQARSLRQGTPETPPSDRSMHLALATQSSDASVLPGTSYRLLEKIGEGSSGEVFEAEHTELGRKYAIKVLSAAHAAASDAVERFRREARAVASLSHPNLVRLHDFGKSLDGRVFLVMERLEGMTLDAYAARGLEWREAVTLSVQVARALEAAHEAGLVHRDLKPQNLFLTTQGELKLLDFGVAMAVADTADTASRQKGFAVFGTPEYMAPEQVAGEAVDARCDLYALGCVLYELITGSVPFKGSPVVVMGKQLREPPVRPSERTPDRTLPPRVEAVVMRALAKAKEERYPSARSMREALEQTLSGPARRRGTMTKLAGVFALGASGMAIVLGLTGRLPFPMGAPKAASAPVVATVDTLPTQSASVEVLVPPTGTVERAAPSAESDAPIRFVETKPRAPSPERVMAPEPRPASKLLVRTSMRTEGESKDRLSDARSFARERSTDPAALRAWANAALSAGELREARRAAETWSIHDGSVEPRLFLSGALDAAGRRREARAVLEEWLVNHPESTEARAMLSRLGGRPEPAVKRSKARTAPSDE